MTASEVVVTLDVGGSGLKLAAYSLDQHRSVAASVTAWPQASRSADESEFDVQMWWQATLAALGALIAVLDRGPSYSVAGITVGAARIPFVLLDEDGPPAATPSRSLTSPWRCCCPCWAVSSALTTTS